MSKNRAYQKGVRKERRIIKELKNAGFDIAHRTAGSHSPIDVFGICRASKEIVFIQSKPDNFPQSAINKIYNELDYINLEHWTVRFELI